MRYIGKNSVQEIKKEAHVRFQVVMVVFLSVINVNIIIELLDL